MRAPLIHPRAPGLVLVPKALSPADRAALLAWLSAAQPLWEQRYSTLRPPPPGQTQRPLLRPVIWLGNWQFACLGYYEPPRRVLDAAVEAEPFPPVLAKIAADAEARARRAFPAAEIPKAWRLNTCLVNLYGDRLDNGRWVDAARVGDHRDFEPGPVASLSLGDRALFQFVRRGQRGDEPPVRSMWLEDSMLQLFSGPVWKDALLHRVQRVEDKRGELLGPTIEGFRTRRVNLTFRYVPQEHIVPFRRLGAQAREDVRGYVTTLAATSEHWRRALEGVG
ncbi:alpha-ketoglutarate-dependent dioxygenase AlkB [Myxococcota bacterium]|nr:alpha-ketoglutarate-dependent dioxygenase AlkB [Myxococcota bacterium]